MNKATSLIAVIGFTLAAPFSVQADATKQTFTGRVSLSKPKLENGQRVSNLGFSGTIQAQGTEGVDFNPSNFTVEDVKGSLAKAQRVSNKSILEKVVPGGSIKGWSLRWNAYAVGATPLVEAFNKKSGDAIPVPDALFSLDASWPADFDGIFKGTASFTVSSTASGTVVFVNKGRFTGFNTFLGNLKLGEPDAIIFSGAGTFRDDTKGFSGKASVAGDNYTPAPSF